MTGLAKWMFGLTIVLVVGGLGVKEWRASQIVGHASYRFNLVLVTPGVGVTFVSFDPTEKAVLALPFPPDLSIQSRNSGEYSITALYKLGSYSGEGGMFARQKIQGFMRVPIPGYIVSNSHERVKISSQLRDALWQRIFSLKKMGSSLSRLDSVQLLLAMSRYSWREISGEELVRSGVIVNNIYHPERLQEFVGRRFFDWGIGADGVSVAVVNASGENGLGSDMADFLSNLGMDVVMVRSATSQEVLEKSHFEIVDDPKLAGFTDLFASLFGFGAPTIGVDPAYRAQIVVWVGRDARELF